MDRRVERINHICLIALTSLAIMLALYFTKSIMIPFTISLFLYAALTPLLIWLCTRLKMPRNLALSITIVFFLLLAGVLTFFVISSIQNFIEGAGIYKARIFELIEILERMAVQYKIPIDANTLNQSIQNFPIFSLAKNLTGEIFDVLGNSILIIIFVVFLISGEKPHSKKKNKVFIDQIQSKVSAYISAKLTISFITAALVFTILSFTGVELAFMFSVLTFFLNFIPNIGSLIATFLPLPILYLQFGMAWQFYFILLTTGTIQFVIGNVIETKIMGTSLDLHPVSVLLCLLFWGLVWGLPGMFLAVPITAILKIILGHIPSTQPLAELLAGRI